jgi:hypothetical protein
VSVLTQGLDEAPSAGTGANLGDDDQIGILLGGDPVGLAAGAGRVRRAGR